MLLHLKYADSFNFNLSLLWKQETGIFTIHSSVSVINSTHPMKYDHDLNRSELIFTIRLGYPKVTRNFEQLIFHVYEQAFRYFAHFISFPIGKSAVNKIFPVVRYKYRSISGAFLNHRSAQKFHSLADLSPSRLQHFG